MDGGHVWVASLGGSVTELNAANGSRVRTLSGGSYGFSSPEGIATDGTHVWVTNLGGGANGGGSVTELNAKVGLAACLRESRKPSSGGQFGRWAGDMRPYREPFPHAVLGRGPN